MNNRRVRKLLPILFLVLTLGLLGLGVVTQRKPRFVWPNGKRASISFTFDDARPSQVDNGRGIFSRMGVKGTFYVLPGDVERRLDAWRQMIADGHEIANHSLVHPCSGNYTWSSENPLENYTIQQIEAELDKANQRIHQLLGVTPQSFAYPCGRTSLGRGRNARSYIPSVAAMFLTGRSAYDDTPNDPLLADFAQLASVDMDEKSFERIEPLLKETLERGAWLILMGHEINREGPQTTRVEVLERLLAYAQAPENGFWSAPVGVVAQYVQENRAD